MARIITRFFGSNYQICYTLLWSVTKIDPNNTSYLLTYHPNITYITHEYERKFTIKLALFAIVDTLI